MQCYPEMQSRDPITVLIVDDEALIRMMVADELVDHGFITLEAEDAGEALAMLGAHPEVSILFTDINMPGAMNGIELANAVSTQHPDMRIFLASGRERPGDKNPSQGRVFSKAL